MAKPIELPEEQRRTLDRLKPIVERMGLYLAGGTAVALHLGHRMSRDIDLFSREPTLDLELVRATLTASSDTEVVSMTDAALRLRVGNVPVDIVKYPYAPLAPICEGPGLFPMAGLEDLTTMKLAAVARRGIRRDFWDLYEIFRSGFITLPRALESYVRRYGVKESDPYHVLRTLTYFEDADADPMLPDGLTMKKWDEIKAWFVHYTADALREQIQGG